MCFHFQQQKAAGAFQQKGLSGIPIQGQFNGFSHPQASVLTAQQPTHLYPFQWGLIPHWAKNRDIQKYTLNAKWETVTEKPSFRKAKPCLVPADGFFEWQWLDAKGKQKQKFKVGLPDENLFMFAGLWDEWVAVETGEIIHSFALVTTAAQGIMQEIHNSKLRMPLVLSPDQEMQWLENRSAVPFIDFEATPVS
ncbi:MAG: SOS response-associated peptidase [Flavobacteriaceae bacterium]